jgi:hypothetical protein
MVKILKSKVYAFIMMAAHSELPYLSEPGNVAWNYLKR